MEKVVLTCHRVYNDYRHKYRGVEEKYSGVTGTHNPSMEFHTYILYSKLADKYYIGHTNDTARRLVEHNSDRAGWTKPYQPWELAWSRKLETRAEAMKIERYLKSLKDRKLIAQYIAGWRSSIPACRNS